MSLTDKAARLNDLAAEIMAASLAGRAVLLCDAAWPRHLPSYGAAVWRRRCGKEPDFGVWRRRYDGVLMGMPRAREEMLMNLHLAASSMNDGAALVLFGMNDGGAGSAAKMLRTVFSDIEVAVAKFHGRVFLARGVRDRAGLKGTLDAWRKRHDVMIAGQAHLLDVYPGMFAAGRLDAGSALLIAALADRTAPKQVLDFACGAGVLALAARHYWPEAKLHLLDHDALAVEAARRNVPGATVMQGDNLAACGARYDLIVSNPPIHDGPRQDYGVVESLLAALPRYLTPRGRLLMVTQQTVPVARFAPQAEILAQAGGYRVSVIRSQMSDVREQEKASDI